MKLIKEALKKSISYGEYRDLHQNQVKNSATSGANQSENLIAFTKLNHSRSKRWDKRFSPSLNWSDASEKNETWVVITETWCGDAAQNVPVLNKIAEQLPNVDLRIVFRDENLELMDQFLTNGGKSIPKMIRVDGDITQVLGTWGPRPEGGNALLKKYKADDAYTKDMFSEDLAKFYVSDNGAQIEAEIMMQLKQLQPA